MCNENDNVTSINEDCNTLPEKKPVVVTPSKVAFICGGNIIPYKHVRAVQHNTSTGENIAICLNDTSNVAFLGGEEAELFCKAYVEYLNLEQFNKENNVNL